MTRIIPSAITGSDFLSEVQIVFRYELGAGDTSVAFGPPLRLVVTGGGGGLNESAVSGGGGSERDWRRRGRADTSPREKTKEPTPRSICVARRTGAESTPFSASIASIERPLRFLSRDRETHERGPPSFGFGKLARKGGKVDRQDAQDGHDHHDGSVTRHERLDKQSAGAADSVRVRVRGRLLFEDGGERRRARRSRLTSAEPGDRSDEHVEEEGIAREGSEREQEREDQDGPLGEGDRERVASLRPPPSPSEPSVVDNDPQGIRGLAAAAIAAAVSGGGASVADRGGGRGRTSAVAQTRLMCETEPPSRSDTKAILAWWYPRSSDFIHV